MKTWSEHKFLREREAEAFRFCSMFLSDVGMDYLRDRLDYDVRSEFGNFRLLVDLWFKIFRGDYVRLIEFYEGTYDDRDIPRHEALIEAFLVTLAATIIGEEYKARRDRIGRALLSLHRKCRASLEYLFDMDALKYLEANQVIDHVHYIMLAKTVRRNLLQRRAVPKRIKSRMKAYYRRFGVSSSSDILQALEKRLNQMDVQTTKQQKSSFTGNIVITLTGIPASEGIVSGKVRNVRNREDIANLKTGDIGVFHLILSPYEVPAVKLCAGLIGIRGVGGMTGHLAIVARGLGKPAVMQVADEAEMLRDGKLVIVDGDAGKILVTT